MIRLNRRSDPWRVFTKVIKLENGCWLSTYKTDSTGYIRLTINNEAHQLAHRVAYQLYYGIILPVTNSCKGKIVMHLCNNKKCVNPKHLQLGSQSKNMIHSVKSGTHHSRSKLTPNEVRDIRSYINPSRKTIRLLATKYNIHIQTVKDITTGFRWKHIV